MDKEQIKKALDHFENDEYVNAKEIIAQEIQSKRDEFLQDKLGLKDEISSVDEAKFYTIAKTAKERALKSLEAIIKATDGKGGDSAEINKMAVGMKKSYEKNEGFSKDQADWIWKTSEAMFNKD